MSDQKKTISISRFAQMLLNVRKELTEENVKDLVFLFPKKIPKSDRDRITMGRDFLNKMIDIGELDENNVDLLLDILNLVGLVSTAKYVHEYKKTLDKGIVEPQEKGDACPAACRQHRSPIFYFCVSCFKFSCADCLCMRQSHDLVEKEKMFDRYEDSIQKIESEITRTIERYDKIEERIDLRVRELYKSVTQEPFYDEQFWREQRICWYVHDSCVHEEKIKSGDMKDEIRDAIKERARKNLKESVLHILEQDDEVCTFAKELLQEIKAEMAKRTSSIEVYKEGLYQGLLPQMQDVQNISDAIRKTNIKLSNINIEGVFANILKEGILAYFTSHKINQLFHVTADKFYIYDGTAQISMPIPREVISSKTLCSSYSHGNCSHVEHEHISTISMTSGNARYCTPLNIADYAIETSENELNQGLMQVPAAQALHVQKRLIIRCGYDKLPYTTYVGIINYYINDNILVLKVSNGIRGIKLLSKNLHQNCKIMAISKYTWKFTDNVAHILLAIPCDLLICSVLVDKSGDKIEKYEIQLAANVDLRLHCQIQCVTSIISDDQYIVLCDSGLKRILVIQRDPPEGDLNVQKMKAPKGFENGVPQKLSGTVSEQSYFGQDWYKLQYFYALWTVDANQSTLSTHLQKWCIAKYHQFGAPQILIEGLEYNDAIIDFHVSDKDTPEVCIVFENNRMKFISKGRKINIIIV